MTDWWTALYDDLLADLFLDGADPAEAGRTADDLVTLLGLSPGDRVFDQGCGTGRLSKPLLARGMRVVGVDLAPHYIARSQAACADFGDLAHFEVGDIGEFVPKTLCNAAISWWTCLGYAPTDAQNVRPLRRAWEALLPGGVYAVDFMNVAQVLRDFAPSVVRTQTTAEGLVTLERRSQVDLVQGVLHKQWIWTLPDGRVHSRPSAVRLYMPHELGRLLHEAEFVDLRFFGDSRGTPLTADSERCIVLARRPV